MRRRITVVIVGVVASALLLSGLFTLLLARRAGAAATQRELRGQAATIASALDETTRPAVLQAISKTLRLNGIAEVVVTRTGAVEGALPVGVDASRLDVGSLRAGTVQSGRAGRLVFAAAPFSLPRRPAAVGVVIITREPSPGIGVAGAWFVVAAVVCLLAAVAVAAWLGRRITAPLEAVEATTRRMAAGDLDARASVDGGSDPELRSLAASVNTLASNLAQSRGHERQFLMAVSHDLRTPLTSIRGFAEAIADGAAPDHTRAAEVIATESRRLERLVGDLLDLAKLDARRFSFDLQPVDVGELAAATAEGFRPELTDLGLSLEVPSSTAGSLPVVARADPDRLAQVVANLVENALKFASTTIAVAVAVDRDGHHALVAVDDDGPGIAAADLPHVFERLYQSPRTPARRGGSGLGLAIVAELVAAMNGTVEAQTPGPTGTRMLVRLPLA